MSINPETKLVIIGIAEGAYDSEKFFNEVEFKKDVYNIFIIKKMIVRFIRSGNINEKLVMNNIIIALNTFGIQRCNEILRLAMDDAEFAIAKSFLLFLDAFSIEDSVEPSEVMIGILRDTASRYHLSYRE